MPKHDILEKPPCTVSSNSLKSIPSKLILKSPLPRRKISFDSKPPLSPKSSKASPSLKLRKISTSPPKSPQGTRRFSNTCQYGTTMGGLNAAVLPESTNRRASDSVSEVLSYKPPSTYISKSDSVIGKLFGTENRPTPARKYEPKIPVKRLNPAKRVLNETESDSETTLTTTSLSSETVSTITSGSDFGTSSKTSVFHSQVKSVSCCFKEKKPKTWFQKLLFFGPTLFGLTFIRPNHC